MMFLDATGNLYPDPSSNKGVTSTAGSSLLGPGDSFRLHAVYITKKTGTATSYTLTLENQAGGTTIGVWTCSADTDEFIGQGGPLHGALYSNGLRASISNTGINAIIVYEPVLT